MPDNQKRCECVSHALSLYVSHLKQIDSDSEEEGPSRAGIARFALDSAQRERHFEEPGLTALLGGDPEC